MNEKDKKEILKRIFNVIDRATFRLDKYATVADGEQVFHLSKSIEALANAYDKIRKMNPDD